MSSPAVAVVGEGASRAAQTRSALSRGVTVYGVMVCRGLVHSLTSSFNESIAMLTSTSGVPSWAKEVISHTVAQPVRTTRRRTKPVPSCSSRRARPLFTAAVEIDTMDLAHIIARLPGRSCRMSIVSFPESCLIDHETTFESPGTDILWRKEYSNKLGQHDVGVRWVKKRRRGLPRCGGTRCLACPLVMVNEVWRNWRCHVSAACSARRLYSVL
jgi:hypothetical protein